MRLHIRGSLKVQSDFHSSCRSFLLAEVWLDRHRTWESVRAGVGDDLNVWWILHFLFPIILFDAVTNRNEWQLWKEAHQPESLLQRSWCEESTGGTGGRKCKHRHAGKKRMCPLSTPLTDRTYLGLPVLMGKDVRTGWGMKERRNIVMREDLKLHGLMWDKEEQKDKTSRRWRCFLIDSFLWMEICLWSVLDCSRIKMSVFNSP